VRCARSLFGSSALLALGALLAPLAAQAEPGSAKAAVAVQPSAPPTPAYDGSEVPANVDADAKAHARTLYERGAKAYAEARYAQAVDAFLEADRVFPTPQLRFNIAKAYDRIGQPSGALSYYRDYLRRAPDAADFQEVTARVRELEQQLAQRGVQQLTVLSDPENAVLLLDGKPVGLAPWTGETWPGKHRVRLELAGYTASEDVIELEPLHARDVSFKLAPTPPETKAQALARAEKPAEPAKVTRLTWVVLATSTAALGTALFVEMANEDPNGLSRTGAFFGGAGLAAAAVGGVLLYVDLSGAQRVSRVAALAPTGVQAAISGRF
jgi:tetratricopeptide (TPR) repeat protein